jgi:hypothetical protein
LDGTSDAGFETATYGSTKKVISKNASVVLAKDQFHLGKSSLQIKWGAGQDKAVRLSNYLLVQKNKYYKLGLWISSAQDGHFQIALANATETAPVAAVGVVASPTNQFRYYEYNFRSPLDASDLVLTAAASETGTVFLDDVQLLPLAVEKTSDLSAIKMTSFGNSQSARLGEQQTLHPENSDALAQPGTLIGQIFSPQASDLVGVTFFLTKKGDGGAGEYAVEIREFNDKTQLIAPQKIAVKTFPAKDIQSGTKFMPLFAKLEAGKKYWLGLNNAGVKVTASNYLAVGQTSNNAAYPNGNIFLQKGENKFFTEEKDLFFSTSYAVPTQIGVDTFSFGETLFDLGQGKKRLDYRLDGVSGANVLEIFGKKNATLDKNNNVLLNGDDAYVVYKIKTNGQKVARLMLSNLAFHNNIQVALSTDGAQWTEIFADNTGKPGQNSGRIDVAFQKDVTDIFLKLKKNGASNSTFVGAYVILDLVAQK